MFRIFLIKVYGLGYLSSGSVLDVAGGKGDLSWELANLNNIRAVLVEPRQSSFGKKDKDWTKGLFEPKRLGPVFSKWNSSVSDGDCLGGSKRPEHLRVFFRADSFQRIYDYSASGVKDKDEGKVLGDGNSEWFLEERRMAQAIKWTTKGLEEHDGDGGGDGDGASGENEEETSENFNKRKNFKLKSGKNEITSIAKASEILSTCKLLVGIHPDQACGDIAELADSLRLPWCVIPCCTYSNLFSKRKLLDGTRVTTHGNLIQWLVERFPEAKVTKLDSVEGKNVVVYCLPKDKG